jgi:hypothetical protein
MPNHAISKNTYLDKILSVIQQIIIFLHRINEPFNDGIRYLRAALPDEIF